MKKFLLSPLAFVMLFTLTAAQPAGADMEKVTVSHVQGAPVILRNGQSIPAAVGTACQKGDILKTDSDCVLDVAMNNRLGCRVLASSECLITGASENEMVLEVKNGNVILNVDRLPEGSQFKVETPTAIAAVRGTQFWGRVDLGHTDNPVTTFAVREGIVEIFAKSFGRSYTIEKGQALDIPKDTSAVPGVRRALSGELQAMEQASAIKTSA